MPENVNVLVERLKVGILHQMHVPTSQTNAFSFGQAQQCNGMVRCNGANTFLHARLLSKRNEWIQSGSAGKFWRWLTLQEFGGTKSCVISPAWTQKRCNNAPLYRSHKQTAKSTPPESKCALSYLNKWIESIESEEKKSKMSGNGVPWMRQRWTQQTINSSAMSSQYLMRRPFWIERKMNLNIK